MFGPNQVGELMVGNASASQTTVPTFRASATDKQLKVLSKDGTVATLGKPFYVLQKATGIPGGIEFSDKIDPRSIDRITVKAYAPEIFGAVKVDGFATAGAIAPKRTYEVEIRVENQLSVENFEILQGYYVTGEVIGSDTATTVRDGLLLSLNKNLKRRGDKEFTAVADGTGILITEKEQINVPGRIDGRKQYFTVRGKIFENVSTNGAGSNLGFLIATQVVVPFPGNGTGKYATNYEYFVKGMKYDANREFGYPANFADVTPYYASKAGIYNVVQIKYFATRTETSVERQYKVLTIIVEKGTNTLANNASTNSILADIRTAVGTLAVVPADLPVV
jgi:hypothetical protein